MITADRHYRSFDFAAVDGQDMTVEGYAAIFNSETTLYVDLGVEFKEVIQNGAFDGVDLTNVVMNFNHEGKPVATTRNGTLHLYIDEIGLKVVAYLGGTEAGRQLWEEIKGEYIDKMSFCFDMSPECERFDLITHKRIITAITAVYDVAAVDQPAYDKTCIFARNALKAEADRATLEEVKRMEMRKRLAFYTKLKRSKLK